jgi:hypothetical protein
LPVSKSPVNAYDKKQEKEIESVVKKLIEDMICGKARFVRCKCKPQSVFTKQCYCLQDKPGCSLQIFCGRCGVFYSLERYGYHDCNPLDISTTKNWILFLEEELKITRFEVSPEDKISRLLGKLRKFDGFIQPIKDVYISNQDEMALAFHTRLITDDSRN